MPTSNSRPVIINDVQRPAAYRPPAGPLHVQYLKKLSAPALQPRPDITPAKPVAQHQRPTTTAKSHGHPASGQTQSERVLNAAMPEGFEVAYELMVDPKVLAKQAKAKTRRKISTLAIIGLVFAAVFIGLSLFSLELGQILLAFYAVIAIWKRVASQQIFAFALAMFAGIIVASAVPALKPVAENLAVYAFLLLCIGTIALAREVRSNGREPDQEPVSQQGLYRHPATRK